jgi:hypothetical protein
MLRPAIDASGGSWVLDRLESWLGADEVVVVSIVPRGFEAYACIFHSAVETTDGVHREVTWAEFAARHGKVVHPEMQWNAIAGFPSLLDMPADVPSPVVGNLGSDETLMLASLLREFTATTDEYWFCVWSGYPVIDHAPMTPVLKGEGREYLVFVGSSNEATSFPVAIDGYPVGTQAPNLWWPTGREWCVGTDIDLPFTFVGGSSACISRIVSDPRFEALETRPTARVDSEGDLINS